MRASHNVAAHPLIQEAKTAHKQIHDELKGALDEGLYGRNVTHTPLAPTMTGKGLTTTVKSLIGAASTKRGIQYTLTSYREIPRHLRLLRTARNELEHHRKTQPPEKSSSIKPFYKYRASRG